MAAATIVRHCPLRWLLRARILQFPGAAAGPRLCENRFLSSTARPGLVAAPTLGGVPRATRSAGGGFPGAPLRRTRRRRVDRNRQRSTVGPRTGLAATAPPPHPSA